VAPALGETFAPERARGGFESLVGRGNLGAGVVLVSLLIAAFWGAAHALTPGHGKALVAGYLVGSRGQPRHAVLLGTVVTATHTAGVFALGFVTLLLSRFIVPGAALSLAHAHVGVARRRRGGLRLLEPLAAP
jgi:hypothetical protein